MPEYLYYCPTHGDFPISFSMGAAPPIVICRICKRESRRIYQAVPVQYHSSGFSKSLPDRPDERLGREIKHSMDFDVTTGKSWEETDKELERKRAEQGELLRKDVVLPT